MTFPQLAPNGRAIVTGPTGCGKTSVARVLLRAIGGPFGQPARNVIMNDPKHMFSWNDPHPRFSRIAYSVDELMKHLLENESAGTTDPVIFRPRDPTNYRANDEVARIALSRGHTTLAYDELSLTVGPSDPRYTAPFWAAAMVTGRGLGVGVLNLTQRPSGIPKIAKTEAEHRFTFFLRDPDDQKTVDGIFGGGVPWDTLADEEFSFVYADDKTLRSRTPLQPLKLPKSAAAAA